LTQWALWLVPGAPLVAAVLIALVGPIRLKGRSHWPCILGIGLAFVASLWLLLSGAATSTADGVATGATYPWIDIGGLDVAVTLRCDAMTAVMLTTVTFVSLLVAVYASGYMHHDPGYPRFFAEVSLFVFSMCMLVLAQSFLVLFVFWEAVGLCSYLLVGFWFGRPAAAAAAKKAFVVNRVGDLGFLIGLFLMWKTFGSLSFDAVLFDQAAIARIAGEQPGTLALICLLLFIGAMGKSAQAPLHVWLPDAMEGPTPVSALIHAATMVTAGVYLVARATPLFVHAPQVQLAVGCVGGVTATMAALIALTQTDLKRVLAWSTVSQLGYMFLALGAGAAGEEAAAFAVMAAMFHLVTHAFFKAVLFLGAGSVMHAMGDVIDMRRFGGLRRIMPQTHWTFLCGTAALAGFPVLAGFWSKDEILVALKHAATDSPYPAAFGALLIAAVLTAVLTAFYSFRAYFLTFWGPEVVPPEAGHHAHESPPSMTVPLMVLGVLALGAGLAIGPTGLFAHYLEHTRSLPEAEPHHLDWLVMAMGTVAALVGIGVAGVMYAGKRTLPATLARAAGPLYGFSQNRFYIDELLTWIVVMPLWVVGRLGVFFDRSAIDGLLDVIAAIPRRLGWALRPLQNGRAPSYAMMMLIGLTASLIFLVVLGSY
jgi:NADH-quinone oxidoreductase subunit L